MGGDEDPSQERDEASEDEVPQGEGDVDALACEPSEELGAGDDPSEGGDDEQQLQETGTGNRTTAAK
jgi:hypothetical protein